MASVALFVPKQESFIDGWTDTPSRSHFVETKKRGNCGAVKEEHFHSTPTLANTVSEFRICLRFVAPWAFRWDD